MNLHRVFIIVIFLHIVGFSVVGIAILELKQHTDNSDILYSRVIEINEYPIDQIQTITQSVATQEAQIKIPIIMYHYIEYVQDQNDTIRRSLSIQPVAFEQQLQYMYDNGFTSLFVKDVPYLLKHAENLPEKPIILTFDDGYKDFYTDAFPLLKKYHMRATIYVVNNFIGRADFMDQYQIKELIDSEFIELGAHTLDHINLSHADFPLARRQIIDSKKELEQMFGISVETFAYPYGGFNQLAENVVKEASYSAAVSVINGSDHSESTLFHLYRIRAGAITGDNIKKILQ